MTSAVPVGFVNARDVGGLWLESGRRTRHGVLYRSEVPIKGDPAPRLDPWPPSTVCDLRSVGEQYGSHPLDATKTTVLCTPLIAHADLTRVTTAVARLGLVGLYEEMLVECADNLVRIAEAVATSLGPTLVHCAAGKDRTGVAIALLLAAVGVRRGEIVKDYVTTARNMPLVRDRIVAAAPPEEKESVRERLRNADRRLFDSPTHAIERVLDRLDSDHDGAMGWLARHGLEPAHIGALKARLVAGAGA
jgi:protein-tyrosine phosphatase